jgi:hypothetical protein
MNRSVALVFLTLALAPGSAAAQGDGRFQTGVVTWTPTLSLRDAGVDSNVYDEPVNPRRDHLAIFGGQVEGTARLRLMDVRFGGGADYAYYQRYTAERGVNTRLSGRLDFRTNRVRPYLGGGFMNARERVNSEIDVRARRIDSEVAGGLGFELSPRALIQVGGTFNRSTFQQGETFLGVDLAHRLNRESTGGVVRLRYEITPLTRFIAEGGSSRDRFVLSPDFDARNVNGRVGFEFEPDAVIKGRATVGYHRLDALGNLGLDFEGITAAVDLGYVLLQRTRFDVKFARGTSYSFEPQPYFLQTMYGGEVLHTLFGPVDLIGRASWETLDYPGIVDRALPADRLEVLRYGGGIALRPGTRIHLTVNYELTERTGQQFALRQYDRRRLFTNVTYGF